MALNEQELSYAYQALLKAFPEDLHIARPMIQMLQDRGDNEAARNLAMDMARRMLALGYSTYALAFITICEQLKHPDMDEIESIKTMAELTLSATHQDDDVNMFELIETLSDAEAKDFLRKGTLLTVQEGESIVKQGEISRKFYLILDGVTRVHIKTRSGEDISLNELKEGDFFGEFACVYHLPRTATVTALSEVKVLEFGDMIIAELMEASPEAGESLVGIVQRRMIASVAHAHPSFVSIAEQDRAWLVEESELIECEKGDSLLSDPGEYFYIIAYGKAEAKQKINGKWISCTLGVNDLYANAGDILSFPTGVTLVACGRCLIYKAPLDILTAFFQAYGDFEHWVDAHVTQRRSCLPA